MVEIELNDYIRIRKGSTLTSVTKNPAQVENKIKAEEVPYEIRAAYRDARRYYFTRDINETWIMRFKHLNPTPSKRERWQDALEVIYPYQTKPSPYSFHLTLQTAFHKIGGSHADPDYLKSRLIEIAEDNDLGMTEDEITDMIWIFQQSTWE